MIGEKPVFQTTIAPPPKAENLTGLRFGRLVVIGFSSRNKTVYLWLCKCDCGNIAPCNGCGLKRGDITSCGCQRWKHVTTHGMSGTSIHRIWKDMNNRCANKNNKYFHKYGGRGITVCQEWRDSFEAFAEHIGPKPSPKHSLDRIDNNRGYEPGNVRWATRAVQNRNTRQNRWVTISGQTMCITDWCKAMKISVSGVYGRIYKGWSEEEAIMTPLGEKPKRKQY
jgi:hypothetical protein